MTEFGKIFIVFGIILIIIGIFFVFGPKIPFLGKLPGDIFIKKGNFAFYSPIVTSIIISLILTLIFSFLSKK